MLINKKPPNLYGTGREKLKDWSIKNFQIFVETGKRKLKRSWLTFFSTKRYAKGEPIYRDYAFVIENRELGSGKFGNEVSTLYLLSLPLPLSILAGMLLCAPVLLLCYPTLAATDEKYRHFECLCKLNANLLVAIKLRYV